MRASHLQCRGLKQTFEETGAAPRLGVDCGFLCSQWPYILAFDRPGDPSEQLTVCMVVRLFDPCGHLPV